MFSRRQRTPIPFEKVQNAFLKSLNRLLISAGFFFGCSFVHFSVGNGFTLPPWSKIELIKLFCVQKCDTICSSNGLDTFCDIWQDTFISTMVKTVLTVHPVNNHAGLGQSSIYDVLGRFPRWVNQSFIAQLHKKFKCMHKWGAWHIKSPIYFTSGTYSE